MDTRGVSFKESIDQITKRVGQHLNAVNKYTTGNLENKFENDIMPKRAATNVRVNHMGGPNSFSAPSLWS